MDVKGMKVAVIVADGFEQRELDGPVEALKTQGVHVEVLAPDERHLAHIHGVNHFEKGRGTKADKTIDEADADDYDGLLVPGGTVSPDTMRQSPKHLALVKRFVDEGKPTAVICHGPWLLADAGVAKGRTLTSWPGIRRDLERAGATWKDEEVVVDGNLVTSRKPADVPAFSRRFLETLEEKRSGKVKKAAGA